MKLKVIFIIGLIFLTTSIIAADNSVINADDKSFDSVVKKKSGVVLVDFHAKWCGPCNTLSPEIDKLAKKYKGKASIVKVDVDKAPKVSNEFKIQYIPHVLLFKDGKVVKVVSGRDAKSIAKDIDAALGEKALHVR